MFEKMRLSLKGRARVHSDGGCVQNDGLAFERTGLCSNSRLALKRTGLFSKRRLAFERMGLCLKRRARIRKDRVVFETTGPRSKGRGGV